MFLAGYCRCPGHCGSAVSRRCCRHLQSHACRAQLFLHAYPASQGLRQFRIHAFSSPASGLGNSASQYPDLSRGARRSEPSSGGFGNSASQYPDLSRGARRSEPSGSGFGDSASKHPDLSGTRGFSERPRGFSDSPAAATPVGREGFGFSSGPGPGSTPYVAPAAPKVQSMQHNSIQSSIAAAQAIAARLAAGGGAGAPPLGPPRVTPIQPTVSIPLSKAKEVIE